MKLQNSLAKAIVQRMIGRIRFVPIALVIGLVVMKFVGIAPTTAQDSTQQKSKSVGQEAQRLESEEPDALELQRADESAETGR